MPSGKGSVAPVLMYLRASPRRDPPDESDSVSNAEHTHDVCYTGDKDPYTVQLADGRPKDVRRSSIYLIYPGFVANELLC